MLSRVCPPQRLQKSHHRLFRKAIRLSGHRCILHLCLQPLGVLIQGIGQAVLRVISLQVRSLFSRQTRSTILTVSTANRIPFRILHPLRLRLSSAAPRYQTSSGWSQEEKASPLFDSHQPITIFDSITFLARSRSSPVSFI